MHIWAVANQKGGVGKTTTTVALGGLLAESGARVLLLDLDPQGSLTTYFGHNPEILSRSSFDLFQPMNAVTREGLLQTVQSTAHQNLWLLPASTALATLERKAVGQEGMGLAISRTLSLLWDDYDYVLIDSPPTLGVLLINALAACELILIPVQTEFLAIKGLERMLHTLGMVMRSRQKPLRHVLIPTLFDRRTQAGVLSLRRLRGTYPQEIWRSVIPVDTRLRDASSRGVTPSALDPASRGVRAYGLLLKNLLAGDYLGASAS
ncbi:MAG: ParA family protein [Gammaproteobacteria bacterium]|nr:ParA family protein [Gammaproteobacteria bacterium]MDP2140861.1 ParA family protein [Gammaproteobacteria bacterium]MDP2349396.1 ParA family protein [Gammaproteobacteria bacterium]